MSFSMNLYRSSSYLQSYSANDYPVSVDINDELHVGYRVLSNKASLEVFAESCWATAQPSPYSTPYYMFLKDG